MENEPTLAWSLRHQRRTPKGQGSRELLGISDDYAVIFEGRAEACRSPNGADE